MGLATGVTSSYSTVNLPKNYNNINYLLFSQTNEVFVNSQFCASNVINSSSFQVKYSGSGTSSVNWYTFGFITSSN